jgi:hypothetical protein
MRGRWQPPLRVPHTPHTRDDRGVPVASCGCVTCVQVRDERVAAAEAQHWDRVAAICDLEHHEDEQKS